MTTVQQLIRQLSTCRTSQEFAHVAALLTTAITEDTRLSDDAWKDLLSQFPTELHDTNPDLLYCRGIFTIHHHALAQAITLFQRAMVLYQHQEDHTGVANCALALITLHLRREDFATAHLQMLEAESLLTQVEDEAIQTRLYLRHLV